MRISTDYENTADALIALFTESFTESEGADEGAVINKMVTEMLATVPARDMFVFSAWEGETLLGAIIFSRMQFGEDDRTIFILSPVAVAPAHQRKGVGQYMLRHGLDVLRDAGVDIALTYGNPNYYDKVGFAQITPEQAAPPQVLKYPFGWLGQPLTSAEFAPLKGPSSCVDALNKPEYW